MNVETLLIGTTMISFGLYDTYFATNENELPHIGWIGEVFMLSGGALLVGQARSENNLLEAVENVATSMITVKGMK